MGDYRVTALQLHPKPRIGKGFGHGAIDFNGLVFFHHTPFPKMSRISHPIPQSYHLSGRRPGRGEGNNILYEANRFLGELADIEDVFDIANEMRQKRNLDLYQGGALITDKDAESYLDFVNSVFEKVLSKLPVQ
jgi:hypothetical protein